MFFKNFVHKTRAKFVNKDIITVVELTSTWLSDIGRSYKLVKGYRCGNVQFISGSGDAANPPSESKVKSWRRLKG